MISRNKNKPGENNNTADKSLIKRALGELPYLELDGNREVRIEGCKGVLEYSTELIRINANQMVICFKGRALSLKGLSPTGLIISGFITNIEFSL